MKQLFAVLILCALPAAALAQSKSPRLASVTPESGKPAAEYTAAGENLDKDAIKELYLTNGKDDIKVSIVTQKADAIQFKVPGSVKPGRYALMVLTADGKQFIEQPVKLTIE
ncbi:MAG: hypothetical protein HYX27_08360 [Acidobacteria bacterium]|nr:hypothetical protein [Acidobacteriota bacterium]